MAWPRDWLLTYMPGVVTMLARLPHVFVQNRYLSAVDMALCYVGVVAMLIVAWAAKRRAARFSFVPVNKQLTG
ncbi:MAG TPA: hypothetical protein VGM08_00390 [Candidatus Saccharimonadales bacterium]